MNSLGQFIISIGNTQIAILIADLRVAPSLVSALGEEKR